MSTTCNMLRIISRLLTDIRSISGKTYCYLINYRYIRKYPFLNISVSQKHLFSIELHLDLLNCKIRICTKINLKKKNGLIGMSSKIHLDTLAGTCVKTIYFIRIKSLNFLSDMVIIEFLLPILGKRAP